MPITTLAIQIWAFCASTSRTGEDRWLHPGADSRRSGQSRLSRRTLDRDGWRSFDIVVDSICRIRFRVTP